MPTERGTIINVDIKQGVGFTANDAYNAAFQFARHVDNLSVIDLDNNQIQEINQSYTGENLPDKSILKHEYIIHGVLALNESWNPGSNWTNSITLDNGGFLVQQHDPNLLPSFCFGYTGEVNFVTNTLKSDDQ